MSLCALFFCGCASDGPPSLSDAEEFDAYAIYYAGDEVDGLPLEEVIGPNGFNFVYGECELPEGEGGCSPPLQIQNFSTCDRWAGMFHHGGRHLFDLRGAKATGGGGAPEIGPLEIFTGRTTVVIGVNERSTAKSAARQLRDVKATGRSSHLPPPAPGSLRGELPCQRR